MVPRFLLSPDGPEVSSLAFGLWRLAADQGEATARSNLGVAWLNGWGGLKKDEAEAVSVAKQYLSYFQGRVREWDCADQRLLRHAVPENRMRAYDMRALIATMADTGSMLEIRKGFGHGINKPKANRALLQQNLDWFTRYIWNQPNGTMQ